MNKTGDWKNACPPRSGSKSFRRNLKKKSLKGHQQTLVKSLSVHSVEKNGGKKTWWHWIQLTQPISFWSYKNMFRLVIIPNQKHVHVWWWRNTLPITKQIQIMQFAHVRLVVCFNANNRIEMTTITYAQCLTPFSLINRIRIGSKRLVILIHSTKKVRSLKKLKKKNEILFYKFSLDFCDFSRKYLKISWTLKSSTLNNKRFATQ